MDSLHWDNMINGQCAYKDTLTPVVGKILCMEQETCNEEDCFAICHC